MTDSFKTARRRFVGGIARAGAAVALALLSGPQTVFADPPGEVVLDPEERKRLRRELRQAHRERMREARDSQRAPESQRAQELSAHGPTRHGESAARHDAFAARHDLHPGPGRPRETVHHGMPFSEEEREQLRRQLRAQRASRRDDGLAPGAIPGGDGGSPAPAAWRD
jgi:uncharacterized membrane protein